jgi:hypothetical protein
VANPTNAELAKQIAGVTHISAVKVQSMCPTKAEKDLLVHLLGVARSAGPSWDARVAKLETQIRQLADLILLLVRHIHGLTGLPALRKAAEKGTNDELALKLSESTNLILEQIRRVAPRRSDKQNLIALLDITYSRMNRHDRKAALCKQIPDLADVILRLVKRVL